MKIKTLALVFPGQGSQSLGMLSAQAKVFAVVSETFAMASEVLGYDLWQVCQEGPETRLNDTRVTQLAMLVADVAMWRIWLHCGGAIPAYMAGHSLGEYAALVAAETLRLPDAVAIVQKRAELMHACVAPDSGAMAAIIGLDNPVLEALCEQASSGTVSIANYNSIGQTVIAGEVAAVDEVIVAAKSAGAKIAKKIPVSVPCHCALLSDAKAAFADFIAPIKFSLPNAIVLSNVDAAPYVSSEDMKERLVQQLVSPVQWVKTIQTFAQLGVTQIDECGPGKVLTGMNKRIDKTLTYRALGGLERIYNEVVKCP